MFNQTLKLDLILIANQIQQLSNRYGIDYDDLTNQNFINSPKKYKIPVDFGDAEIEGLLKHKDTSK